MGLDVRQRPATAPHNSSAFWTVPPRHDAPCRSTDSAVRVGESDHLRRYVTWSGSAGEPVVVLEKVDPERPAATLKRPPSITRRARPDYPDIVYDQLKSYRLRRRSRSRWYWWKSSLSRSSSSLPA